MNLSSINFETNNVYDFGSISLSEQEIIDFAKAYDPLDFHIDREAAKKSVFKGLITSGPHVFHVFYKNKWVPLFKDTVICGLEVTNWRFLKPIYADRKVFCKVTITDTKPNVEKWYVAVRWKFEFFNEEGEHLQILEMVVLHKLNT